MSCYTFHISNDNELAPMSNGEINVTIWPDDKGKVEIWTSRGRSVVLTGEAFTTHLKKWLELLSA